VREPLALRPWTAAICGRPGDGSEILVDWIAIACREQRLMVEAVPLEQGLPFGFVVQVAPADGTDSLPPLALGQPVDVLVVTEHMETLRAIEAGLASPTRTSIVASCTRAYEAAELGRGLGATLSETDIDRIAVGASRRYIVAHGHEVAGWHRLPPQTQPAFLLGMMCASRSIGLTADECRHAIYVLGVAVPDCLKAFDIGLRHGRAGVGRARRTLTAQQFVRKRRATIARRERDGFVQLIERIERDIDAEHRGAVREAVYAVTRYESAQYASMLLDACSTIQLRERSANVPADQSVMPVFAAGCVNILAYADPASIASTLIDRSRLQQLRKRHGISRRDVYELRDRVAVNRLELADLYPSWIARRIHRGTSVLFAPVREKRVVTNGLRGALALRCTALLARNRHRSARRELETACFDLYVAATADAITANPVLGALVARSAALLHGTGAARAASRVTAESFWGSVVRQSLAIDTRMPPPEAGELRFSDLVVPAVYRRLIDEAAPALWDSAAGIVGCALHLARGGSPADVRAYAEFLAST
jgi:indolepyruvate ferredoxin oxidoreductase beta subunit